MKVTVCYIGSSLLAPLKSAERELNREYKLGLRIDAFNFGSPLSDVEWHEVDASLRHSEVVFVIHVMDGENAARLIPALADHKQHHRAVIVINCMPELMRQTRMGKLDVSRLMRSKNSSEANDLGALGADEEEQKTLGRQAIQLVGTVGSWIGRQVRSKEHDGKPARHGHGQYLKLIDRLPGILRFIPTAGGLRDVKHYLNIFCYFLQPTPANIRCMILYALKEYVPDKRLQKAKINIPPPDRMPSVAIYHPDSPKLFESFELYRKWYEKRSPRSKVQGPKSATSLLEPSSTVGLLLMRPQVVSKTTKHYDALIRAIEAEGLECHPGVVDIDG